MFAERRAERLFVALPSPVAAAKALKNGTELDGMREAHLRDAVALAETFVWLEQQVLGRGFVSPAPGKNCTIEPSEVYVHDALFMKLFK